MRIRVLVPALIAFAAGACTAARPAPMITPAVTTAPVANDADDPAVWLDHADPSRSLVIATNKVAADDGALYVFGLNGQVKQIVRPLDRPNNVDVEYGLPSPSGRARSSAPSTASASAPATPRWRRS